MSDQDPHGDPTRVETPVSDPTAPMPVPTGAMPPTEPSTPGGPPPADPPGTGEPPPDRRPWLIIGLLVVILLVLLALLLNDDDDDADDGTTTTTTSSTTSSTTSTTESTTTTEPTTTTTAPPTTIDPARCVSSEPDDPDITAGVVYDAYAAGDQECASNLMTAEALDELFAIPGSGGGWTFMGCDEVADPEADPTTCSYRFESGSTAFQMQYDGGWVVFDVSQTAD